MDLNLRVVVAGAEGTLMTHHTSHLHSTTKAGGTITAEYSIAFSQRVRDAWQKAQSSLSIEVNDCL